MFQIEGDILLFMLILLPAIAAFICFYIGRFQTTIRDYCVWGTVIIEFLLSLITIIFWSSKKSLYFSIPNFGINGLYLEMDGFRALYCTIASFMWMCAGIFSKEYLNHHHKKNRYYLFLLLTLFATQGVFLSTDLITTFVFFEIMSFTSYVWVVQEETKEALKAGETYLAIAVISGLVLLMGLFLLYTQTGTLKMDKLLSACRMAKEPRLIYIASFCLLFGFGAKAGMFPLHIWLPKAHPVAPAPASALLSGILTKAGVFGILVTGSNILLHDSLWGKVVLLLGTITMVLGAIYALCSINLKRTLACSSMSQIGFILVGTGISSILGEENQLAVRGTILHMVNHSLLKLVLFLAAGVIYMNLHELDLNKIRGFGKDKPFLKVAFLFGALGISGVPFFNGYISKSLLHEAIIETISLAKTDIAIFRIVEVLFLISGGLTTAYMTKLYVAIFVEGNIDKKKKHSTRYMNLPSTLVLLIPTSLLFLFGTFPSIFMDRIADMGQNFLKVQEKIRVSYFSFENLKGAIISLGIGALVYLFIVRKLLMRTDKNGVHCYISPVCRLDLENGIYRPIIEFFLPTAAGAVCRGFDRIPDRIILFLRKTIYRHSRPKKKLSARKEAYIIGMILNECAHILNKTLLRKHPIKRNSFVGLVEAGEKTAGQTGRLIIKSVSFGLMLFSIGLIITLFYLLFFV